MASFSEIERDIIIQCDGYYVDNDAKKAGFNMIYPFATENIDGYIKYFDIKGKSLLTVGSSSDQAFNANFHGCNDVTIMDINQYTKFYYYLKYAALMTLDYNEFLEFFRYKKYPTTFKDNRNVFNESSYDKLKEKLRLLDYESFLIWDELFNTQSAKKIRDRLFETDEGNNDEITMCNSYLKNEEAYLKERKRIKKLDIKFVTGDLKTIKLDKKYDNIWLSNIGTYCDTDDFKKIVDRITSYLNDNGKMLVCYLYTTQKDTKYIDSFDPIYDLDRTFKVFEDYELELINFIGTKGIRFKDNDIKDAILLYEKKVK